MNTNLSNLSSQKIQFGTVVLQGTAYEVGRLQGEVLRSSPGWLHFLQSGKGVLDKETFRHVWQLFDVHLSGVNEEIQGMADAAGVAIEDVIYYTSTYLRTAGCSHCVVLPQATENGHVLVARSYDFGEKADDLRLCTTDIQGRYKHSGFSVMLFGRSEGMNEHGLSVTMSAGGIPVGPVRPPIQDGFQFWALVRALLERCRDVDEALDFIQDFPLGGNPILLLADRKGKAAMVEVRGAHKAVREIEAGGAEAYLFATNHYTLGEMMAYQEGRMHNSLVRGRVIEEFLKNEAPQINAEKMKALLGKMYPQGLCCHHYAEFFGCMHAMVFDVTDGTMDVCFGSPNVNAWNTFDVECGTGVQFFDAEIPNIASEADFWGMEKEHPENEVKNHSACRYL